MVLRDGKLLLGRRRSALGRGTFGWTGGRIEVNETVLEAASRELEEETGMLARSFRLLAIQMTQTDSVSWVDFELVALDPIGDPVLKEPDKVESWGWFPLDDLPGPLFPPLHAAIEAFKTDQIILSI
jgi:8-oxo-dGTP diphosphatase